jgi:environmental stress-induced protein Ves
MIGRQHDYKVKLLKDNKFHYAGDRYLHACGFEVWCSDFNVMLDEEFELTMKEIAIKIAEFDAFQKRMLIQCQELINKIKFD